MKFVPNDDQAQAFKVLDSGANVFLTGVAGVGKTVGLNHWLGTQDLQPGEVAVTASTGIAATHLNGQTIHSWAGIGIGDKPAERIASSWFWRENVKPRIYRVKKIIIDEISMVDGATFELLGEVIAIGKASLQPWGGVQLIVVGDMGQLAPVNEEAKGFTFETDQWWDLGIKTCELRQVMRQQDATFVAILRQVRDGVLSPESEAWLNTRVRAYDPDRVEAVRLMTHNVQVDAINEQKLASLPGAPVILRAIDTGKEKFRKMLDTSCLSPAELKLKPGARVMFTKNASDGSYCNGTLGRVRGFEEREILVGGGFDEMPRQVKMLGVVVAVDTGYDLWVGQQGEWKLEGLDEEAPAAQRGHPTVLAKRVQYPLRLAWAITVHKSQGMTLDLVSVDLQNCFAPGQAYVALSRARSIQGLNIERWQGSKSIIAHPLVRSFCRGDYVLPSRRETATAAVAETPATLQTTSTATQPVTPGVVPVLREIGPALGSFCSVCREPQFASRGGAVCPQGHGGADSIRDAW